MRSSYSSLLLSTRQQSLLAQRWAHRIHALLTKIAASRTSGSTLSSSASQASSKEIPCSWKSFPFFTRYSAASLTLDGRTFWESTWLMYFKWRFSLTWIVWCSFCKWGRTWNCVTWHIYHIPSNFLLPSTRSSKYFHKWDSWWHKTPFQVM